MVQVSDEDIEQIENLSYVSEQHVLDFLEKRGFSGDEKVGVYDLPLVVFLIIYRQFGVINSLIEKKSSLIHLPIRSTNFPCSLTKNSFYSFSFCLAINNNESIPFLIENGANIYERFNHHFGKINWIQYFAITANENALKIIIKHVPEINLESEFNAIQFQNVLEKKMNDGSSIHLFEKQNQMMKMYNELKNTDIVFQENQIKDEDVLDGILKLIERYKHQMSLIECELQKQIEDNNSMARLISYSKSSFYTQYLYEPISIRNLKVKLAELTNDLATWMTEYQYLRFIFQNATPEHFACLQVEKKARDFVKMPLVV